MKFYNPFKWHIRTYGDKYVVARHSKISPFMWLYYDACHDMEWSSLTSYWKIHCTIPSLFDAKVRLDQVRNRKSKYVGE